MQSLLQSYNKPYSFSWYFNIFNIKKFAFIRNTILFCSMVIESVYLCYIIYKRFINY